jgi:hypothetical protein
MKYYSQEGQKYPTYNKRRKTNWIGHILHSNCLLEHVTEGKTEGRTEVKGRRGKRRKQLLDELQDNDKKLKVERGSTRSHSVENSLWKRLWTCRRREQMNE